MTSPSKSRVQRQRDHFDQQFDRSSPPKIDFAHDSDLFPPTSRYLRERNSGSGSISSASTGTPDRERGNPTTAYPNYYDYSENEPPLNIQNQPQTLLPSQLQQLQQQQQQQQQQVAHNAAMANMAMQVPIQQQQGQGRVVDNSRPPPVTTAQMAAAARMAATNGGNGGNGGGGAAGPGRNSRPPSYAGSAHAQRSPEEPVFPPNKVDLDAARYRQTQQRRPHGTAKDGRPSTNGSGAGGGRPQSSGIGGGGNGVGAGGNLNLGGNPGGNPSPGDTPPMLSPGGAAAHIQRMPTPSLATSVLQPLDAKVVEYGTLMAEAQGDMARLDDEMRQLQERQREAEGRFLEAKSRHDEYRRQYQDVERALKGDLMGGGPSPRGGQGAPPVPPVPNMGGGGGGGGQGQMMERERERMGPGPGQNRPAMASQRTVSAHSDMPSMMSQDSVRTQKKGRFSRIFGV